MDSTSEEGGEIENVDAIKKFIEAQEKEIQVKRLVDLKTGDKGSDGTEAHSPGHEETSSVCSTVIDMVINESELEITRKGDDKTKYSFSPSDKGCGNMSLTVGSKVEAKDFSENWHPAEIIEVDYDDMEVLVHYNQDRKRPDEWINVSSPRLRPLSYSSTASSSTTTVLPGPSSEDSLTDSIPIANLKVDSKELKLDDKFQVGERCLARWRDNRRFVATVLKDLGDGKYEIIFDDGCHWTCNTSRLYKLRSKKSFATAALVSPSPFGAGPSSANPQYPAFHTHLFDPTRDYLGSKSERREMKRKLNIKEIFNIGQKRPRKQKTPNENTDKSVERKPRTIKKKVQMKLKVKLAPKSDLPAVDAVASIIGTLHQKETEPEPIVVDDVKPEVTKENNKNEDIKDICLDVKEDTITEPKNNADLIELEDLKGDWKDPQSTKGKKVCEEEVLEQFEKPDDSKHEEVIDRIKEVIIKLEDGINQAEKTSSPKPELKEVIAPPAPVEQKPEPVKTEVKEVQTNTESTEQPVKDKSKKLSKVKKGKKLKLLREKKVNRQVEKVRNELEMVKKEMSEMRMQMLKKRRAVVSELPESFIPPGGWCCRWVNRQPVGTVSEVECATKLPDDGTGKPPLPRRSVQVEDKRLPEGWTKHMVRRSGGNSAGKWDVVLISADNRRFHTKNEVRTYLDNNPGLNLEEYSHALTDFACHSKLARLMGWSRDTPDGTAQGPASTLPAGTLSSTSPLVKRKKLSVRKDAKPKKKPKQKISMPRTDILQMENVVPSPVAASSVDDSSTSVDTTVDVPPLEDGYVFVGSLKVQIIDNLLRCPAENCFKNFRNNTLLQMHIKHYHRELKKMMGATPKVLDLAYARTMPVTVETPTRSRDDKIIRVKIPRPPKREEPKPEIKEIVHELKVDTTVHSPVREPDNIPPMPKTQDSPKLRQALINKPVKRPKVLLPVRRPDPDPIIPDSIIDEMVFENKLSMESPSGFASLQSKLDFDSAISTHTVTKPLLNKKRKAEKKTKKTFAFAPKMPMSEEDEWSGINSDLDTRSSFPRSETPEKYDTKPLTLQDTVEEPKPPTNRYMYNENGERIKLVRMKREEIINCHCGFREEDGLMVQCELCLCWQHALCQNIQRESEVPVQYTCSICLKPRRGRRSQRFVHSQERMFEGVLAGAKPCDTLRRAHELAGNLLRLLDALHAIRVKFFVATKKDHPKLYLWAEDWEKVEIQHTQAKLNSDYSDLNIVINSVGKENLPIKQTLPSEDHEQDRYMHRDGAMGSQVMLSSLMSSPGAESLDLPISKSELERFAKSVQEQDVQRAPITAPEPEAAIENSVCRKRLLNHVERCQALVEARLDSVEALIAELESQSPSLEDDETAEYFPRTKETIQMLSRDLDTMGEMGVVT